MNGIAMSDYRFYSKGVDNQKRSDISITLRRITPKKIEAWDEKTKSELIDFMNRAEESFNAFRSVIRESIRKPDPI